MTRRPVSAAPKRTPPPRVSVATEDYLKRIDELASSSGHGKVSLGDLAHAQGVTPGTVTAAVRRLASEGLVDYQRYSGVALTRRGRAEARRVLRRHRIIEVFLVEVLGLDWSEVHEEAERLEHALSDKVLDKIDGLVKRPSFDPHGDPIPAANGEIADRALVALADCPAATRGRVARVIDQSQGFLRFADAAGLRPGAAVEVVSIDRPGESMSVRVDGSAGRTIALAAGWKIMVEPGRGRRGAVRRA